MGYKARRKVITLVFEDPDMAGLEVKAHSASIGEVIGFTRLSDMVDAERRQQIQTIDELLELFATKLVTWNLEDDNGTPVPTTRDGLLSLDMELAQDIVLAWLEGVVGVSAPLETTSEDGLRELIDSLPMDPLLESPKLSTMPS